MRVNPTYESLIGVAFPGRLEHIKFPNRDAEFLCDGFILNQLDDEGTRQMQIQQEEASIHAFKESVLQQIAINIGSNLSDMKNDSEADNRQDRINRAITPIKPKPFHLTLMDDTPFETPHYEPSIGSDMSGRINRRLYFEEQ